MPQQFLEGLIEELKMAVEEMKCRKDRQIVKQILKYCLGRQEWIESQEHSIDKE